MRVFVERWWYVDGSAVDVHFDELLGRYRATSGEVVVFESTELAEVIRHCLDVDGAAPATEEIGLELSDVDDEPIIER